MTHCSSPQAVTRHEREGAGLGSDCAGLEERPRAVYVARPEIIAGGFAMSEYCSAVEDRIDRAVVCTANSRIDRFTIANIGLHDLKTWVCPIDGQAVYADALPAVVKKPPEQDATEEACAPCHYCKPHKARPSSTGFNL
jgi:hypothetical protein